MKNRNILKKKNIHFVGMGGIGMSGIARILLEMGYNISGSDVEPNNITRKLEGLGARFYRGHKKTNLLPDREVLVYSSSIAGDNPELKAARSQKTIVAHRAEVLGELFNAKCGIAVTGTHGKTTTTSLISVMLENAGLDPTLIIGGEIDGIKSNAKLGSGKYLVAEADESDSSFLHLKPLYTVITNIEMEHLDHFGTLKKIYSAYKAFIKNTKAGGVVFYNHEDKNLQAVLKSYKGKKRTFGFSEQASIYPRNIKMNGFDTSFECVMGGKSLGEVSLKIPGRHNVLNALAAILVGLEAGLKFRQIVKGMKDFSGAKRRFQLRAQVDDVMLIDDYAHHPTEIRSVLEASRNWARKRLIAVFQPHRYSRTKFFADDFGKCFRLADKVILTDIYAASEKPIKGVTVKCVYDSARKHGSKDIVIMTKESIADHIMKIKKPGDMIIIMGAGDIKKVTDKLCEKMMNGVHIDASNIKKLKTLVKGSVRTRENLSRHTSFRIGGDADVWFEPKDADDLRNALVFFKKNNLPFFIIGNGSNVLAKDNGFNGVLIHLGSEYFKKISFNLDRIRVGAGFALAKLVNLCCHKGIAGMESLVGIPGTIGGAVYMNAGGWTNPVFRNIGGAVESLKVMDEAGKIKTLNRNELKFGYRCSNLEGYVILEAILKLNKGDKETLISSASHFLKMKRQKQALDLPSAGCVFKNPAVSQFTCGQMIDTLGLKGKRIGGAQISTKHANFIVNRGGATCDNVLELAELVKKRVKDNYDIDLEFEVKVL